jgi:hypothetical protein
MSLSPYRISEAYSPAFTAGVSGFNLRVVDARTRMDKVTPGQVFLSTLRFYSANYPIPALLITGQVGLGATL